VKKAQAPFGRSRPARIARLRRSLATMLWIVGWAFMSVFSCLIGFSKFLDANKVQKAFQ